MKRFIRKNMSTLTIYPLLDLSIMTTTGVDDNQLFCYITSRFDHWQTYDSIKTKFEKN